LHATRPDYPLALELADQLSELGKESGDPSLTVVPDFLRGWPLLNLGRMKEMVPTAERAMAAYVPSRDNLSAYIYGFELGVLNLVFRSWARWFLGYPEEARKDLERAMTMARELDHPHTLAFALVGACELHWLFREPEVVDQYTEELEPLAREKGFVYWEAHAVFYRGEQMVREGKVEEGIAQMHRGIAGMRATGTDTCMTRLNTRLAQACADVGRYEEAAGAIEVASEIMERYHERYMKAEIQRHRGEIALHRYGNAADAETHFLEAIATARDQEARSFELRAVMSLARLWNDAGRGQEARETLADIYGRFTEGLGTPDLLDARELLESLEGSE